MWTTEINVAFIGHPCIGKSTLIQRYAHQTSPDKSGTKDVDGTTDNKLRLNKSEAFAAVLCYDLTDNRTFLPIVTWVTNIQSQAPKCPIYLCGLRQDLLRPQSKRHVPSDPEKEESTSLANSCHDYAQSLATYHRRGYHDFLRQFCSTMDIAGAFETSAYTGANVDQLFETVLEEWWHQNKSSDAPMPVPAGESGCAVM
ncbi:Ras- protein Rab-24 [Dimargaris verticillata]|uniref:Ras- protein Rab-24 n=1 Tax=Dimargaris verticillata TaxID=2761393 RepID=A0A9W8AYF9_9FUNG|nr:Ras- protein Rab-24 [Dimargaris verticillata]